MTTPDCDAFFLHWMAFITSPLNFHDTLNFFEPISVVFVHTIANSCIPSPILACRSQRHGWAGDMTGTRCSRSIARSMGSGEAIPTGWAALASKSESMPRVSAERGRMYTT